jgi:adenine-specific DNA-methyltransferase
LGATQAEVVEMPAFLDVRERTSPYGPSHDLTRLDLARARQFARSWSLTIPETQRIDHAAQFARAALGAYAAEATPDLNLADSLSAPVARLDAATRNLAARIGRTATDLPQIEALHVLTSLYPALLPDARRSALGAFYTPPALTSRLLDQAEEAGLDWTTARILDPAAGGGAFLVQAALRLRQRLQGRPPGYILAQVGERLSGLELDAHAAGLAQSAVEIALADVIAGAGKLPSIVKVADTLEEPPRADFDLVVGNPPYGRVTLCERHRRRFARGLYGHANLYGVFTDIALRWVRPGGLIAYLTPTSFLAGQYFSSLRRLLAAQAPPVAIDFVQARQGVFDEVLQETLLAVYRKGGPPGRARIHYLNVVSETDARVTRNGSVGLPADPGGPWLAPREPSQAPLVAHVETMPHRLADWGYGVSTGPLVWNRFKSQLRDRPGGERVHPLIWAEAVGADGRFCFRAAKKNHAPYFKLEAIDGWLLVRQPCVLVQRTTAKEQARRLIAAELPAEFVAHHRGVVVENHLNMVRAIKGPKTPPAVVAALLNSAVVDQVFRCMNGSVAVSAFELEALPLPAPAALTRLARLLQANASSVVIEVECRRLYGLAE